jgi:hypothetical protein
MEHIKWNSLPLPIRHARMHAHTHTLFNDLFNTDTTQSDKMINEHQLERIWKVDVMA